MTDTEVDAVFDGPHDHPVLAALAGCLVLVAAAILGPKLLPLQPLNILLIGGAVLGLLLWLIGFAVTIRLASTAWKLGSLAILIVAGVLAGVLIHRQYETGARRDASSFAELEFGADSTPALPGDAASRGPVSRLYAAAVQADSREQRAFAAELGKLGVGALTSPYLLEQNPGALAKCDAVLGLKPAAQADSKHRAARRAELAQALAAATMSDAARQGIAKLAGTDSVGDDPLLANQLATLDATAELCRLLAKHSWFNQGSYFGFRSPADKTSFDALVQRRQSLAGDAEKRKRAITTRIEQGREMVRAALG